MVNQIKHKVISKGGGLTIPADVRREHDFSGGQAVDITVEDGRLVVSQHTPRCTFCQGTDFVVKYKGKHICKPCVGGLVLEAGMNG